ncbi:MAG: TIGR01777 family protein [SAR202 cluster bacterium]|nr:TIGR01777 family protein [SAR202 cluster bacterium]
MRILVSGGSGLIGRALITTLLSEGHQVVQLVRRNTNPDALTKEFSWDPEDEIFEHKDIGPIDTAIHLSGSSIAGARWSTKRKLLIRNSRVLSTKLLSNGLGKMANPPNLLIVASGMGFYGDRGDEPLNELSGPGNGFLADTAVEWESATKSAKKAGIRVVNARFGLIISRNGGLLKTLRIPFRFALGGQLGDGRQWWPWISLDDAVNCLSFLIENDDISGAVNVTAPAPVRNSELTSAVSNILSKPAWVNLPKSIIKITLGQMGIETMLHSQRALPKVLIDAQFRWRYEIIEEILRRELR